MKALVRAVGKPRPPQLQALIHDYERRASPRLAIETRWVRHKRDLWPTRGLICVLDPEGWSPTSLELSERLGQWQASGARELGFLIGDADGFTPDELERADVVLSLSKLVLPHRLAVLVLVEQLYRAGTILSGHPYHRE